MLAYASVCHTYLQVLRMGEFYSFFPNKRKQSYVNTSLHSDVNTSLHSDVNTSLHSDVNTILDYRVMLLLP